MPQRRRWTDGDSEDDIRNPGYNPGYSNRGVGAPMRIGQGLGSYVSGTTENTAYTAFLGAAIVFTFLIALGAFIWVAVHHTQVDHGPSVDIITAASGIIIPVNSFNDCDNITLANWRLHRVGKTVTFGLLGTCIASSTTDTLDLDFNFTNFPKRYRMPSPNSNTSDVVGTGSVLVEDKDISSVVDVGGDNNEECIDVDIRFSGNYEDGDTIEFSFLAIFKSK